MLSMMLRKWTLQEDQILGRLVADLPNNWNAIHQQMNVRSIGELAGRWTKVLDPALIKGSFLPEEDALIHQFVTEHGEGSWSQIVTVLPKRTSKQCRERWMNHLNPSITHGNWTAPEDLLIFDLYQRFEPQWSKIAPLVPGRTENSFKNRYNSSIKNRIELDSSGVLKLMPATTRVYVQNSPTRRPTRDALARQAFSLLRPFAAVPANPLGWGGFAFAFAALAEDDWDFVGPSDWIFTN
jgi:hypothetical protein